MKMKRRSESPRIEGRQDDRFCNYYYKSPSMSGETDKVGIDNHHGGEISLGERCCELE